MTRSRRGRKRQRGSVEELPSGALRVKVYAGIDPVTKRRHYLRETVAAGPSAEREVEQVLTRLLNQVDERRHPRTTATVSHLLKLYIEKYFDGEPSTRDQYRGYLRKHIAPFIGQEQVGRVDGEIIDSLYAELRRCREHCKGRRRIDHRTKRAHECDDRCRRHECKPLGATAIRHVHYLLSGAFKRAKRWKWVSVNPMSEVEPPDSPPPKPSPPSSSQMAQVLNEAWQQDEDWGAFLWAKTTTGARRGEMCALRWSDWDRADAVLGVERAIAWDPEKRVWFEKDTKTHQQRRITLDPISNELLAEHRARCEARADAIGVGLAEDAFIFSPAPDCSAFLIPTSVSQRYDRLTGRLGIKTTLKNHRHYSATELISGGVDVRTVAGRLGHGSGGTTTLRVYSAWVSEADQRASASLASRMPERPRTLSHAERVRANPKSPYEKLAVAVLGQVERGELAEGDELPPMKQLAAEHGVSVGTVQRAVQLLKEWGMVEVARSRRTTVTGNAVAAGDSASETTADEPAAEPGIERAGRGAELLHFEVRRLGEVLRGFTAEADPSDPNQLRRLLAAAVRRDGRDTSEILDYELDVHRPDGEHVTTFVTMSV